MKRYQRLLLRIWMWLFLFFLPASVFAADKVSLQLIWKNQFQFGGFYAAKELGFYDDAGLDVTIKEYEFGTDVTQDVISGKSDFGVGRSSLVLESMERTPVYLLAAIFQHSPFMLLAKEREDLKEVPDLKGKRIMVTDDVIGMASLTAMLTTHRINQDDFVAQKHTFNIDDLISHNTDAIAAYISNEPYQMKKRGVDYTIFSPKDYGFDLYSDILFTSQKRHKDNPQLVERFLQASLRGWEYAFSHIDEVVDIILKKYNTQNRTQEALRFEANALKKLAYDPNTPLGNINEDRIERIAQVYRLLGFTNRPLETEDLFYNQKASARISLTPEENAWLAAHPEIRLGVDPAYPPFEFMGKGGAYLGMASDYLSLLNERLGIHMRIVPGLTWTQVLEKVKKDAVDALPAVTNTEGRRAYLNFTQPYMTFPVTFWSHKDQPPVTGFKDLSGKKLAMVKDYFYVEYVLKNQPDIQPYFVDTPLQALKAVSSGKANAFIGNLAVAAYLVQRNNLVDLRMDSDVDLKLEGLCYGIRKDWPELVSILDKAIDSISPEKHKEIRDKWVVFGSEKEAEFTKVELTEKEREWLNAHPVIRVHNEWNWPPFNYNKEGTPTGFSIEYMNQLANRIGIKIKYISGEWGELLDQAFNKKLDVMLNIVKTPERQEYLLYTDAYVKNPNVIIATKGSPITDTQSLSGKKVAYPEGFFYDEVLRTEFPEIIRVPMKDTLETLTAVQLRKVDAALGELAVVNYLIRENLLSGLEIKGMFDSGNPEIEKLNIAVRNDWPELQSLLKKAMASITEEELEDMKGKWFFGQKTEKSEFELTDAEKAWLAEHKKLLLGFSAGWAPFEYYDEDGVFSGMTSDFLRILNKRLNVEMVPQKGLIWSEVLEKAKNRELDVISAIVPSEARSEYLHFTEPYMDLPLMLVTRDDAPYIAGIGDLKGKTIAVVKGYVTEDDIKRDFPEQDLLLLDSPAEVMRAVSEGRADALVENIATVEFEKRRLGIHNLKAAAATPYNFTLSYGVRKDWPELVSILDKSLAAFSDIEKNIIIDKWVNLRVEKQIDWQMIWKIIVGFMLVGGSILTVIIIWNRRMAREVLERKRAEERFQAIAATTPGAIIQLRIDKEGRPDYLYLSPKSEEFFGMPPNQVIEGQERLPWHKEDFERVKQEIIEITSAEKDMNLVGRIEPHEGDVKWISINASPSFAAEGDVIYNGFILDITTRKLAELEFAKSERKNKAMSQAVEDALVMIDGKGRVLFWNPAAEKLFGFTESEAMGMNFHDIAAPDEYQERIAKGLAHFVRTGEGPVLGTTTEITARNKDGKEFPVEVTLSSFQIDDEWFAVGTVRDITERKEAEEILKESEQRVQKILNAINTGVIIIDPETRAIVDVNPVAAQMIGLTDKEIIGHTCHQFICPNAMNDCPVLDSDQTVENAERMLLTRAGEEIPILKTVTRINLSGKPHLLESFINISERKKAEHEVKDRLDELEQFSRLTVDRELKMIDLKEEVNHLLEQLGREEKYEIVQ